jgi:hypothetical protein
MTNMTGDVVNFHSNTQTLNEPANGQARIEAQGANGGQVALSDVSSIQLATGNYQDLIFDSHIGGEIGSPGDTETIKVLDNLGVTHTHTLTLGNGENFETIVASNGELIVSTSISYPDGFTDLRGIRISLVPEPSSLVLAGIALAAGVGVWVRRRRSSQ